MKIQRTRRFPEPGTAWFPQGDSGNKYSFIQRSGTCTERSYVDGGDGSEPAQPKVPGSVTVSFNSQHPVDRPGSTEILALTMPGYFGVEEAGFATLATLALKSRELCAFRARAEIG